MGARSAISTNASMTPSANRPSRWISRRRNAALTVGSITRARVDDWQKQVGEHRPHGHHRRADDRRSSNQIIIPTGHGIGGKHSHARPREDSLYEDGATQERREQEAKQRDDRRQSGAEGMPPYHAPLRAALSACRSYEIL